MQLVENGTAAETIGTSVRSSRNLFGAPAVGAAIFAGLVALSGCGGSYRPVVAAINPVGPSAQPQKFAVAISSTGANSPGLATIVDFAGDSVLITAGIGVAPQYLILGGNGTTGYTINGDGTLNVFGISTSLISSQVQETTLLAGATPVSIFPEGTNTYVSERGRNAIGEFQGSPLALRQELTASNPVYVVGVAGSSRVYALSQGAAGSTGAAVAIDTTTNTPTATLPVGKMPVYGVMTADGKRAFVMNQSDGTVSVINAQTNQLDTLPAAVSANGNSSLIPVGASPIWADFAPTLAEMVVANAGNGGSTSGTLSVVSIPLCSAAALTTNPNCDPTNPVDAVGFGTVLANVPVGIGPVMVAALQDGTRAYVANSGNALPCVAAGTTTPTGNCGVSVVNLTSNTVTATISLPCHPSYIAATTGSPTGKVYVVCNDSTNPAASQNMTVIRTDLDIITTSIPLQGTGISVRVTAP